MNEADTSHLELILFQYRTCPFCCKVRTYLDAKGISYEVVEVDAVLRQAIKWSGYKKVPILLAKVENGYQVTLHLYLNRLNGHMYTMCRCIEDIQKN